MRYVIIGGGIAGFNAAKQLRFYDAESEIILLTQEAIPPYNRPGLIGYLGGEITVQQLELAPAAWYAEQNIDLRLGANVSKVDPVQKKLWLDQGQISYDKLLFATGGSSYLPAVEGFAQNGVFTLRTWADAEQIRSYAQANSGPTVVVGGGLLGLEAANSLTKLGMQVKVLERNDWLLHRQLDRGAAAILQKVLRSLGITVITGVEVKRYLRETEKVVLTNGMELRAKLLLVSAGIRPNLKLAQATGITCSRGIKVDSQLRTNIPDIWAAGDVAEYQEQIYGLATAARQQAQIAAQVMAGQKGMYFGTTPSTSLKIAGIKLISIGEINALGNQDVEEVIKSDPAAGIYKKAVLREGRLIGAILLGEIKETGKISKLLRTGLKVDKSKVI